MGSSSSKDGMVAPPPRSDRRETPPSSSDGGHEASSDEVAENNMGADRNASSQNDSDLILGPSMSSDWAEPYNTYDRGMEIPSVSSEGSGVSTMRSDGVVAMLSPLSRSGTDLIIQQSPQREPDRTRAVRTQNKTVTGLKDKVQTTDSNALYENVFLISLGAATGDELPPQRIFLPQLSKRLGEKPQLTNDCIEEAVFERVLIKKPSESILGSPKHPNLSADHGHPEEAWVFRYLYQSYGRLGATRQKTKNMEEELTKCKELVLANTKLCLSQPVLFPHQDIAQQVVDVCIENVVHLSDKDSLFFRFLMATIEVLEAKNSAKLIPLVFAPVLTIIRNWFLTHSSLSNNEISKYLSILKFLSLKKSVAEFLIDGCAPVDWSSGYAYEQTLIGSVLSISSCPKNPEGPFEFFNNPLQATIEQNNTSIMYIWQRTSDICEDVHRVLINIMKISTDLKHKCLNWLGKCIEANRGKIDLWSSHEAMVVDQNYCTDGFFLNLCYVMLKMCQPFSVIDGEKLLRVKPSYCRTVPANEEEVKSLSIHARGLSKEATFVPYTDEQALEKEKSYHFICECFFLTHQALHIGFSIIPKILKLNNNINRLDRLYKESQDIYHKSILKLVKDQLSRELSVYRNLKAAVTEYHLTKMSLNFHTSSTSWLVQLAARENFTAFSGIKLPLKDTVPKSLSYLPEMLMTNLNMYIACLELFKNTVMITKDKDSFQQIISTILIFMADQKRLVNPDIRAQLAENLEAFIPSQNEDGTWQTGGNEEAMFTNHPLINHLSESLLNVFVSIEVRGQSVDSERRFNYRKSMHRILQYIWKIPVHKTAIKKLADKALESIDNTNPPLFLRFINLMINDAIFLLDDALDHMRQIRKEEIERDSGKWNKLKPEDFRDKESSLRHLGMIGRYRNIIANNTMYTLEIITREIRPIFCHPVMVDRIAGMLNYFMDQLVGPKQKDYKVRDRKQFDFRPEQLVSDIAHIYLYLGKSKKFVKAVIEETRSFSQDLFPQAVFVLEKIGVVPQFIDKFREFGNNLQVAQSQQQAEDEMLADAPEDFLDPIMGTLMHDPVTLPTSNMTLDRAVITRHLLSDETDPFNRSPLTLSMVVQNSSLKERIQLWLTEQSNKSSGDAADNADTAPKIVDSDQVSTNSESGSVRTNKSNNSFEALPNYKTESPASLSTHDSLSSDKLDI